MPTPDTLTPAGSGVIHDIGYRRYTGPRLGRRQVATALYAHSVRTAFGLGRSAKAKIFPWLLVGVVGVVAAVLTAVRAQTGQWLISYAEFPENMIVLVIFFCAVVAPELVSRDLHSGVLPLYFARPLNRADYPVAKLAALITAVFLLLAGPLTVMFAGAAFNLDDGSAVWREFKDWAPSLGYAALYAVVFSAVSLLVAALVKRRAVAAAAVVGSFLVTTPVVGVLAVLPNRTAAELSGLASPATLVSGVGDWWLDPGGRSGIGHWGPLYAVVTLALVVVCAVLLLARYRKVASS
jgi:ABC-2 type transport system permease protein